MFGGALDRWQFALARTAPRRPEVEDDGFAALIAQAELFAIERRQGEVGRWTTDRRLRLCGDRTAKRWLWLRPPNPRAAADKQ
jgi:hypothetical protein